MSSYRVHVGMQRVDVCEWKPAAAAALLLPRQLGVSRTMLTSTTGPLTSNTLLMADKLIGLGQAGQQMFTSDAGAGEAKRSCFSGSLFKKKTRSAIFMRREEETALGLWESNKMSNPSTGQSCTAF